jgi:hypothetical protein
VCSVAAFSISNIETIDLSYSVFANDISNLTLEDVLDITDGDNELRILGDSNDSVHFATGDGWATRGTPLAEDGYTFDVYTNTGDSSVSVKVETTIADSIA